MPPERHDRSPHRPTSGWFSRALSWEAREEYYHRGPSKPYPSRWSRPGPSYRDGDLDPYWSESASVASTRSRYSPSEGAHYDRPPWGVPPRGWYHHRQHPDDHHWITPQRRDEGDSTYSWANQREHDIRGEEERRQMSFETSPESNSNEAPLRIIGGPVQPQGMEIITSPQKHESEFAPPVDRKPSEENMTVDTTDSGIKAGSISLLALPEDRISLSETLCVVREVSHAFFWGEIDIFPI